MQLNENRIRERAYQIWEAEGKPSGCAEKHWSMACEYESQGTEGNSGAYNSESYGSDSYDTLGQEGSDQNTLGQEAGLDMSLPGEEHEIHHKKKSKHPHNRH